MPSATLSRTSIRTRRARVIACMGGAAVVVGVAALAWWFLFSMHGVDRAAASVAVPSSWRQSSPDNVTRGRLFCLGEPCPRLTRDYAAPEGLTAADLDAILDRTAFPLGPRSGDCVARESGAASCGARGTRDGVALSVEYWDDEGVGATLRVRAERE